MKRILSVLAVSAVCTAPAVAQQQQADYCHPSGYATGVTHADDPIPSCDPRVVPRVNGVPQAQPAPTARRNYNETQPWAPYVAQQYDDRRYDGRYMGNNPEYWRDGNRYYGARGPEWQRGHRIPREYMDRQYWVHDWRAHRLHEPPRGYQWVQVGGDYALVALATGIIAELALAGR